MPCFDAPAAMPLLECKPLPTLNLHLQIKPGPFASGMSSQIRTVIEKSSDGEHPIRALLDHKLLMLSHMGLQVDFRSLATRVSSEAGTVNGLDRYQKI
ncbi:hypothetical protein R1flu_014729 [Riccia fluitans]|uniref:Uncharacterized protein n=1 Tax=Riccia fluitans TaxID=41844 RepID=A0ABD1YH65_9MARC